MKFLLIFFILPYFNILPQSIEERADLKKYFDEYGHDGCFVLFDLNKDEFIKYNSKRCKEQFIPASTFKIFNSLAALEAGAVKDENEIIKWDSVKRTYENWNQDLDMKRAFKFSAVWFYQELARRIGEERMKQYIKINNYGNEDISGEIDRFWLDGGIRISADDQIEFLKKIYNNEVKFSQRSINILKRIMIYEQNDNYILRAKTGWGVQNDKNIGWFVGYIETNNNTYFFAANVESVEPEAGFISRINITYNILKYLNIIKQ
ncbi:MAG: class D beta-lactamase [Ignavibacterium sp.]|jgi:beta-lactamase class D|nr:class D beta-lactamase [Ignavibacterium sp.]